jgi:hypothetical protein
MRQDIDVSPLTTKVEEMTKQVKILELQAKLVKILEVQGELQTKFKILELKAELEAKHVILEAQIRMTHSASPKSVTSTGRPESPGAKAVKDGKDHVFGNLLAKLSRSAPHARSSNST